MYERFQVLTAASRKFRIVFWDVLPCKIIVDRRFRGTCCLHHQVLWWSLIMEAARTSETSVDNYFTRQYIPEDNSENLCVYGNCAKLLLIKTAVFCNVARCEVSDILNDVSEELTASIVKTTFIFVTVRTWQLTYYKRFSSSSENQMVAYDGNCNNVVSPFKA
jgi:hypothetical protein